MSQIHAVILAAGSGRRLAAVGAGTPKCLLRFAGASLLARQLTLLGAVGIRRATVVTGYEAAQIEQALDAMPTTQTPAMTTLFNPQYENGSALSGPATSPVLCFGAAVANPLAFFA